MPQETENGSFGAVRITNADIFNKLTDTARKVDRLDDHVRDVLKPGLDTALSDIRNLRENKADESALEKVDGRLSAVEYRVYAIISGVIASAGVAKGFGFW